MKTFTKAIACLLSVVLLLTAAPLAGFVGLDLPAIDFDGLFNTATAAATVASGTCGENLTWTLDDEGTLTISGTGAMTNYSSSAPWYSNRSAIKKVVIEDGVTTIGDYAFDDCGSLECVTFGENSKLNSIGSYAFRNCDSLVNITIPDSITTIGERAFADCDSLESITIPDSVTTIGNYAFADCDSLESVTIPDSVTSISGYAFYYCDSLVNITIPVGVTSIGSSAFAYCDSLVNITIPVSVTSIGSSAFAYCDSLVNITIPAGVTSIGMGAFNACSSLKSITVAEENAKYSSDEYGVLFNKDKTQLIQYPIGNARPEYAIPDSVTSIGSSAFYACSSLESITVAEENTKYSSDANGVLFNKNKTQLIQYPIGNARTEYQIPDSVTSIGYSAFSYCNSLEIVTFGENSQLTRIGGWAFVDCYSLVNITIPDSVTSIGIYAFENCGRLASVDFGENSQLTSIGSDAFADCDSLASITIPDSVTSIGSSPFYACSSLESITVAEENTKYSSDANGVLFNKNKTQLIQYPIGNARTEYQIPDSVANIGNSAFAYCTSLESVTFGENSKLTGIGSGAFKYCRSLVNITIPDSVTTIGNYAFYDCDSLVNITIPDSVTSIGDFTFDNCESLVNITIPDGVTTIDNYAFRDCDSLASVTFGENSQLTTIGYYAFYNCDSLESVTFGKNSQLTTIDNAAFRDCGSLVNITIPDSVTSIGRYAFYDCYSLSAITILNPACEIYDAADTIFFRATIYGYTGSTAQAYAEKYNRKFVALDVAELSIFEPYTVAKVSADGFAVVAIGTTVADILAASNATAVLTVDGETVAETEKLATGMQLVLQNGATVVDSMAIAVLGDADGDGTISAGDARLALRISVGLDRPDAVYLLAAKVNGEATITAGDARLLLRASVGLEDPVEWFNKFGESV